MLAPVQPAAADVRLPAAAAGPASAQPGRGSVSAVAVPGRVLVPARSRHQPGVWLRRAAGSAHRSAGQAERGPVDRYRRTAGKCPSPARQKKNQ